MTNDAALREALERIGSDAVQEIIAMPVGDRSPQFLINRKETLTIVERFKRRIDEALSAPLVVGSREDELAVALEDARRAGALRLENGNLVIRLNYRLAKRNADTEL